MDKKIPQISVIMSAFNAEKYILRSVVSILIQSYRDFELIIIDDGSTDRTSEILASIHDERLKLIQQENMGLTCSLNKALSLAQGKWIARHDADDFSLYNRFQEQIDFLKGKSEIKILGSSCFIEPDPPGFINEIYEYPVHHDDIMALLPRANPFVHGSMLINKKLLIENNGYNEDYQYVQDYELWTRLVGQTQFYNLDIPLYVRSIHANASQVGVKKDSVFTEIRDRFILSTPGAEYLNTLREDSEIRSMNFYPAVPSSRHLNKYISKTYYKMARKRRELKLPWVRTMLKGFLYWPWGL